MTLTRRELLQRTGFMLAAFGISEAGLDRLLCRYSEALAQPTARKLALLVGINQYPGVALGGCLTDVELQRELLIARFGFQPSDILTLTDNQATRQNIETAFMSHLSDQAQPEDVVIFHFSGYGSRVMLPEARGNEDEAERGMKPAGIKHQNTGAADANHVPSPPLPIHDILLPKPQNSLVPMDGTLSIEEGQDINNILEETLWLLLRSLKTDRILTVLDTSYAYLGKDLQGNLRVRSRPSPPMGQPDIREIAIQDQLLHRIKLPRHQFPQVYNRQLPGLVLAAANANQVATEIQGNGFNAGLFTYALTQSLWESTAATKLQVSFSRAAGMVEQWVGTEQVPLWRVGDQGSGTAGDYQGKTAAQSSMPNLKLNPVNAAAEGVITAIEENGKTVRLWLGGLPATRVDFYGVDSCFDLVSSDNATMEIVPRLQIRSRNGLTAKAQVIIPPLPETSPEQFPLLPSLMGQLVQERIRVLPRQINLMVALDSSLSRIERVDATSGFASIPQISVVNSEQPADYLLSRVQDTAIAQAPSAPLPTLSPGRYGLFSLGQTLIPHTLGDSGEAIKTAAQRLMPSLKTLLAAKLLRLTANEETSRLKVRATLAMVKPETRVLMQRAPQRVVAGDTHNSYQMQPLAASGSWSNNAYNHSILTLPKGSRIQYRLHNDSDRPVYFFLFCLESGSQAIIVDPVLSSPTVPLAPGEALNLPLPPSHLQSETQSTTQSETQSETFSWTVHGPTGLAETQVIFSQAPFTQTLAALEGEMRQARETQAVRILLNPLKVAQAVLQDLQAASQVGVQQAGIVTENWTLETSAWTTLSFVYRVV